MWRFPKEKRHVRLVAPLYTNWRTSIAARALRRSGFRFRIQEPVPPFGVCTKSNGRLKRSVALRFLFAIMRPWLLLEDKKKFSTSLSRLWRATATLPHLRRSRAGWA